MKRFVTQLLCFAVMILSFFSNAQDFRPEVMTVEQAKARIFSDPVAYYKTMPEELKEDESIPVRFEGKLAERVKGSDHLFFLTSDVDLEGYYPKEVILVEIIDPDKVNASHGERTVFIEGKVSVEWVRDENLSQWFTKPETIKDEAIDHIRKFYRGTEFIHGVHVTNVKTEVENEDDHGSEL